jgi:hypothetical protein
MKPIPVEMIATIPDEVEQTRESCREAADLTLRPMFFVGAEGEQLEYPPIFSNGVELWPLPVPWTAGEYTIRQLHENLNGDDGFLAHTRKNCEAYNAALHGGALPEARRIREQMAKDSAAVWNNCNALAHSVEDEKVYRTLDLSEETKELYNAATGE